MPCILYVYIYICVCVKHLFDEFGLVPCYQKMRSATRPFVPGRRLGLRSDQIHQFLKISQDLLVGGFSPPLWKLRKMMDESSLGIMKFPRYGEIIQMFQTTSIMWTFWGLEWNSSWIFLGSLWHQRSKFSRISAPVFSSPDKASPFVALARCPFSSTSPFFFPFNL